MVSHDIGFVIAVIVALGIGAQWLAWRLKLPAIVLLASAGLLVGPVFGAIRPSAEFGAYVTPFVGLCVAIILFEGGLNLRFHELKVAARGVRRLVYVGAPLGWLTYTLAAHYIGGLTWPVSLVFGAIVVVTGPTVIMPLLKHSRLNRRTASYLKWEGILNDPIGALLAVLVFQFFVFAGEGSGWQALLVGLGKALTAGVVLGGLIGWLAGHAFRRGLVPEYLKSPVMLSLVLLAYTVSNELQHEAGLLAVTIMGVVVGNMALPGIQDMRRFKEYITVMLVSVVFVILTADLDAAAIGAINWRGAALIAAVLLLARPAAILLATAGAGMERNDRLLLAWIAPRGIVAAATAGVMGPRLIEAGYATAESLLPLVFGIIFATVLAHGLSLGWLSQRLGLAADRRQSVLLVGASPWSTELALKLQEMGIKPLLADSSWHNLRSARLAGIPVFYGEILSDFAEESVETTHVSTVLAATSNDAYNALVCMALAPEVGRSRVFQLPMGAGEEDNPRGVARPLRGQVAFDSEALFEKLWRLHVRGWKFYRTRITANYSYSAFLGDAPPDAVQILVLKANGSVQIKSVVTSLEPEPGDTVLYFAPERPVARAEKPAAAEPSEAVASE